MNLDDITKLLGIDVLNEEQQKQVIDKINDIIDIKVKEKLDEAITEEKENLISLYEEKFEEYKKDITEKFSNFVDSILEEELVIPEKIEKFAKKGELYDDLIEQFKLRIAVDEGTLDEEARKLLKEARDEILNLQEQLNDQYEKNLALESDVVDFAAEIYKREKCEGLTEEKRDMVMSLLEDVKTKNDIDRKFDIIVNSNFNKTEKYDDLDVEGKGLSEVEENKSEEEIDEDKTPFKMQIDRFVKLLREND